jgi:antitoxin component of MazEF toxin-antitoxin module
LKRKIRTNGDSAIVALPPAALEQLDIKPKDYVDVKIKDQTIYITKVKEDYRFTM